MVSPTPSFQIASWIEARSPHPSPLSAVLGAPLRLVLGAVPFPTPVGGEPGRGPSGTPPRVCFPCLGQWPLPTLHSEPRTSPPTSSIPKPALPSPGGGTGRAAPAWGLVVRWPRRLPLAGQWGALQPAAWSGPQPLDLGERRAWSSTPSPQPCWAQLSRATGRLSLSSAIRPQSPHLEKPFLDPWRLVAFSTCFTAGETETPRSFLLEFSQLMGTKTQGS